MKGAVKFEFVDDHIEVVIAPSYEFDAAASGELWDELERLCEEHKTCRVLVEGRAPEIEPDTSDVIAAGQRTATIPKMWMAFHFEDFVPNEKSELFEVIAASKGVRVKHFADREPALMWLRNNAPE
jgi:hypothetical protein